MPECSNTLIIRGRDDCAKYNSVWNCVESVEVGVEMFYTPPLILYSIKLQFVVECLAVYAQ